MSSYCSLWKSKPLNCIIKSKIFKLHLLKKIWLSYTLSFYYYFNGFWWITHLWPNGTTSWALHCEIIIHLFPQILRTVRLRKKAPNTCWFSSMYARTWLVVWTSVLPMLNLVLISELKVRMMQRRCTYTGDTLNKIEDMCSRLDTVSLY